MSLLEGIEYFARSVEAGSFAGAARRLRVTPSAVSRKVAQLERELGVPLLTRTTRTLSLTPDGASFHLRCLRILEELGEARDALARVRQRPSGLLRVDAPVALGRIVLAPRLPALRRLCPELDVALMLRDRLADPFVEGSDVLVRMGALRDSPLVGLRLGASRLLVCASPAYLRRHGTPLTPDDLRRHACLAYLGDEGPRPWRFRDGGRTVEHSPRGSLQANDPEVLIDHARSGHGLVVAFDFLVAAPLARGELVSVLDAYAPPDWPIHALYAKNRHLVPKVRAFLEFLGETFGSPSRRSRR